jgi:uncharacterized membrane protein
MRRFLMCLAVAAMVALSAAPHAAAAKSKVYHMKGDSYYGTTKSGMYACKSDAEAKGAHAAGGGKMSKSSMSAMASPMPSKHKKHKKSSAMSSASPAP